MTQRKPTIRPSVGKPGKEAARRLLPLVVPRPGKSAKNDTQK